MISLRRIILQVLFWSIVWITMALGHTKPLNFIEKNWLIIILQISVIVAITLYVAPKLLEKNKKINFVFIGFIAIIVCALLAYQFTDPFPIQGNPFDQELNGTNDSPRNHPPPRPRPVQTDEVDPNFFPKPPENLTALGRLLNSPFLINFLLLCLTFVLTAVVEVMLFAKRKEEALMLSKNETLETELKLLKSQINPHFLFNALNNIYALSAIDSNKTQESISYLSNMLRYVLYECEHPFVPIQKEVDYILNYIKLYKLKSSKDYPIDIKIDIINNSLEIVPMLLIPFVENAFKHSNIEAIEKAHLHIFLETKENEITFKIENTIATENIKKDDVGGIGLENVKKRLSILYPKNHTLQIIEDRSLFQVILNITTYA